jgi:multiple sugar transport system substrate-binding protein
MARMHRLVLTITAAMLVASGLTQTEVSVWFHSGKGPERDALAAQVEAFNIQQSEYRVVAEQLPEGTYNDQVQAAALSNDLPCLLDFDGPFIYNYAWSGFLRPIDDYVSAELRADILPSILAQGTYDGRLYSLGTFDSGLGLYANRSYLEVAGVRIPTGVDDAWTVDEFEEALARLTALDEVEYALDLKFNYGQGEWFTYGFSPIIQSAGADLIDRNDYLSAAPLTSDAAVEALTRFQSWFENGWATNAPAGDVDFHERQIAALAWVGHWQYNPHVDALGDDLVLLPLPDFGTGSKTGMGSWNWGITTTCEVPDGAWAFLEFLMQPEEILRMTDANGAVPSRLSAIDMSDLYGEGAPLELFVEQLESGAAVPRPQTPAYPVITDAFAEAIANIAAGADVARELATARQRIEQDIEDNRGYPTD